MGNALFSGNYVSHSPLNGSTLFLPLLPEEIYPKTMKNNTKVCIESKGGGEGLFTV